MNLFDKETEDNQQEQGNVSCKVEEPEPEPEPEEVKEKEPEEELEEVKEEEGEEEQEEAEEQEEFRGHTQETRHSMARNVTWEFRVTFNMGFGVFSSLICRCRSSWLGLILTPGFLLN